MSQDQSQHDARESLVDLAALYVAGAMSREEMEQFEQRLEGDAQARAAVKSFDDVDAFLIQDISPITPDPKTKERLFARIELEKQSAVGDFPELPPTILRADEQEWRSSGIPGVTIRMLYADRKNNRMTVLIRLAPGTVYPGHVHDQPEECLMLEGDLDFGDYVLNAGDYLRQDVGTTHAEARTKQGCVCLVTAELVPGWVAA